MNHILYEQNETSMLKKSHCYATMQAKRYRFPIYMEIDKDNKSNLSLNVISLNNYLVHY